MFLVHRRSPGPCSCREESEYKLSSLNCQVNEKTVAMECLTLLSTVLHRGFLMEVVEVVGMEVVVLLGVVVSPVVVL